MTADEARDEARCAAEGTDFIARLAGLLAEHAGSAAVFGDPVERDGVTVIPVARAAWGFGGGEGEQDQGGEGRGGGGGAIARPHGYIEIGGGVARYRRLRDPLVVPVALAAGALAIGAVALVRGRR